jgi:hypothetical protein
MRRSTTILVTLAAIGALLALPATAGSDQSKRCAKTPMVGYMVSGTLVSFSANTVTLTVTGANSHARNSGDIADTDAGTPGVQVEGATYTVAAAADPFEAKLHGYNDADTPSVGDEVHVFGKIPRTKKKCAAEGTSLADRYGTVNVLKVSIFDRDPDA